MAQQVMNKLVLCVFAAVFLPNLVYGLLRSAFLPARLFQYQGYKSSLSDNDDVANPDTALLKENVELFNVGTVLSTTPSPSSRQLPLFGLNYAFYPCGETVLRVFEMRYRYKVINATNVNLVYLTYALAEL